MSGTVAGETLARFMRGVRVTMDGSANVVRIEIQNRGTIPPELLPLIFDPMSGGGHRRTGSRGLGLGLYITREIVSAHGGTISVTSDPSTGTTFRIELPRGAT